GGPGKESVNSSTRRRKDISSQCRRARQGEGCRFVWAVVRRFMANDAQKRELQQKVTKLVDERYGGDWTTAFQAYARLGGTGGVDKTALAKLLEDAGVGNRLTRGAWTNGVMEVLDLNADASISWAEFQT